VIAVLRLTPTIRNSTRSQGFLADCSADNESRAEGLSFQGASAESSALIMIGGSRQKSVLIEFMASGQSKTSR
jgi:hypothetical protein